MTPIQTDAIDRMWGSLPSRKHLLIVLIVFLAVGSLFIVRGFAASPQASLEAEGSSLNGSASVGSDAGASGGKYLQLGAGIPAAP